MKRGSVARGQDGHDGYTSVWRFPIQTLNSNALSSTVPRSFFFAIRSRRPPLAPRAGAISTPPLRYDKFLIGGLLEGCTVTQQARLPRPGVTEG